MLEKSQLKYIQSLGQKKSRDQESIFIAEGPKIVGELLRDFSSEVKHVYALPAWIELNQSLLQGSNITAITEIELQRISQLNTPNDVLALVAKMAEPAVVDARGQFTLVLDTIQDPGNLGTIIRLADWFGIEDVVCSHECADRYNPKVVQSTMSSIARVRVKYTDLATWIDDQDVKIYGALMDGQDVTAMQKPKEGIIIIGNESKGISDALMKRVNVKITIPKKGHAESLNAAMATGIILSHLV